MTSQSDISNDLESLKNKLNTKTNATIQNEDESDNDPKLKKKTVSDILNSNIKNFEEFVNNKVINLYARPWNKLEFKFKKAKIEEYVNELIETNESTQKEGQELLEMFLKEIPNNKKFKVTYDTNICKIITIKY